MILSLWRPVLVKIMTIKLHGKSISIPLQQIWWACCVFLSSLSSTFFSVLVIIFNNISYFCFDYTRSLIIRILFSFIPRIIFLMCIENYNDAQRGHMTSFLWKWKLYDFSFEKRLVGHILKKNNGDLVFQTCTIFLKWVSL